MAVVVVGRASSVEKDAGAEVMGRVFLLIAVGVLCLQRPSISRRLLRTARIIANKIQPLPASHVAFARRRRRGSFTENQTQAVEAHHKRSPGVSAIKEASRSRSLKNVAKTVILIQKEPSETHQPRPCGPKGVFVI
jgi:hypothetical protein